MTVHTLRYFSEWLWSAIANSLSSPTSMRGMKATLTPSQAKNAAITHHFTGVRSKFGA